MNRAANAIMKAIADHAAEQQTRPNSRRRPDAVITPTSHAFDADGIRLVVHDWGGAGAPVLLAHPTGFHGRVWAPIATALVAAGRHVWSFDFRGHGDSDAPDVDYSWHGFADDVLAVAEHLGLAGDPALVACGHSKGGAALILGEQKRPGTFARIWAYEPIIFASEETAPAAGGLLPGARGPQAAQRMAFDRRGVRGVRVEAAARRDDRGVAARVRRLRATRPRRRRARAEVPARGRSARVLDGRRTTARTRASARSTRDVARGVRRGVALASIRRSAPTIAERIPHGRARGAARPRPLRPATGPRRVRRVDPALRAR